MKVIGITGPTGAGKTTVLGLIRDRGATVLDCDLLWYDMVDRNKKIRTDLENAFGPVFLPDGKLDRAKLGGIVFADEDKLRILNGIVYYHMGLEVRRRLGVAKRSGLRTFAIDAVNLLESGLGELCDVTVAVLAPEERRISRIMVRDGIDLEMAVRRVHAQKPEEYYRAHARLVLENNGTREDLLRQAESLLAEYL